MSNSWTGGTDLFAKAVDHAPGIFLLIDAESRIRYANRSAKRKLDLEPESSGEWKFPDLTPPEAFPPWEEIWEHALQEGGVTYQGEFRQKTSGLLPVDLHALRMEHEDEEVLILFARDISSRRATEAKLEDSRIRLQAILDHADAPVFVKDLEGKYLLVNERFRRLFALTDEEILNHTDFDIFEPEVAQSLRAADQMVADSEIPLRLEEMVPVEGKTHIYISTKFPLRDQHGQLCAVGGIASDITEQKEAQNLAATQADRIRQLYEAASTPGLTLKERIAIKLNTGCRLLGLDVGIVSQKREDGFEVRHIVPGDLQIQPGDFLEPPSSEESAPPASELDSISLPRVPDPDLRSQIGAPLFIGGEVYGSLDFFGRTARTSPFSDTDQDFVRLISRWISNRLEIEDARLREQAYAEELSRSNRDLEQFAYISSHDLQEPLRAVSSFADLLLRRYQGALDERADRYLKHIADGTTRMGRLINDLLAYSKVQRRPQSLGPVALDEVFSQALENLEVTLEDRKARVQIQPPLPTVQGDATQLCQLFQNLIGNAVRFCQERTPEIHIRAAQEPAGFWTLSVQDNGPGIKPEFQEQVFQIFERLHSNESTDGTGIGLAICRKIAERHGGRIWVESEPDQGATFFVTLQEVPASATAP